MLFSVILLSGSVVFAGSGGSGKGSFNPKKINIDKIESDQEFAEAIPEYSIRFTGSIDRQKEITFQEIVSSFSDMVESKTFRGTRTDEEVIEVEYTGIRVAELLKDRTIGRGVRNVVVYGIDKYAASITAQEVLDGGVFLVWKKEGRYLVPGQDGVLKIVQDRGLTRNWVKNPIIFEFTSEFFDKVPPADRLNEREINFVDQQSMFTLDIGGVPTIKGENWKLKIGGIVENPRVYAYEELRNMPQTSVFATLETISNPPGGRLIGNAIWMGVSMKYLFNQVKPKPDALEVVFKCRDGYTTSLTLEEALKQGVILAHSMNGRDLAPEHGYPLRAVVPDKYGMKWPKWIEEIEFVDYDYKGYWESRGWSDYAGRDRPDQRYD